MIISFDDSSLGVGEVKIVRTPQGVDLGRLRDTHEIYKNTIHDRIGVGEATTRLDEVLTRKPKFKPWCVAAPILSRSPENSRGNTCPKSEDDANDLDQKGFGSSLW